VLCLVLIQMAKFDSIHNSNSIDEKIKEIAYFHFPFITETYLDTQVDDLKRAVNKLKSDCDLYLECIERNN
jgi:hypothetical protein